VEVRVLFGAFTKALRPRLSGAFVVPERLTYTTWSLWLMATGVALLA
jgi:hypothetical protein